MSHGGGDGLEGGECWDTQRQDHAMADPGFKGWPAVRAQLFETMMSTAHM